MSLVKKNESGCAMLSRWLLASGGSLRQKIAAPVGWNTGGGGGVDEMGTIDVDGWLKIGAVAGG